MRRSRSARAGCACTGSGVAFAIAFCLALSIVATASASAQMDTVVLDAAHGGSDIGTQLAPQVLEKDLVLTLSIRLRSALTARGMHVVTTRERDLELAPETRAAEANHAHALACLVLHATASGTGVHLYTSSLSQANAPGGLAPWSTAAAPFATESLKLASEISTALAGADTPFTLGRVRLAPLDALRCPAVALEIAPLHPTGPGSKSASARIDEPAYLERLVDAVAAALVQWHGEHASSAQR